MLVYSYAIDFNSNIYLYSSYFVAFNLRWKIIAGIRTRSRMDDTLHRYSSDTAMDADRDAEKSKIAARAGKSI